MKIAVKFSLNGREVHIEAEEDHKLLWLLRTDFNLTGTKYGCGVGLCGACSVLIDGKAARSCKTEIRHLAGAHVITVEGLEKDGKLHPLQQAFIDQGALQCGYCTSGMLIDALALLNNNPKPSRGDIIAHMEPNLCRCGAHNRIVDAIESVVKAGAVS